MNSNTMIEQPRDAAGFIIPIDKIMMYKRNHDEFYVEDFFYEARGGRWFARHGSEYIETNELYLCVKKEFRSQDDSWDKLLDDIKQSIDVVGEPASCKYLGRLEGSCGGYCRFRDEGGAACMWHALQSIESRIQTLLSDAE